MVVQFTSPYFNESSRHLKHVNGMSVLLEPAYVDSCLSEEFGLSKELYECHMVSNEPEKISVDQVHSTNQSGPPCDDLRDSGEILKASAALHFSHFSPAPLHTRQNYQQPNAVQLQQKDCRKRRTKRHAVLLIATQLSELQSEDPEKIVIVRKINRLGFDSADILKEHFEHFGVVDKVRLSNAHNKEPGTSFQVRLRPSGIGFVVFENSESAAQVLAEGETRLINGVEVYVRGFERRRFDSSSTISEEAAQDVEETSSVTTISTRCSSVSYVDQEEE